MRIKVFVIICIQRQNSSYVGRFFYTYLGYTGPVTVPTLYDKKLQRVVSNDSASILRMMNSEFQQFCSSPEHRDLDLYPEELREKIEEAEEWTNKYVKRNLEE